MSDRPGYAIPASCAMCGGELAHITSSRPTSTEASAITECAACGQRWQVLVRLCLVPRDSAASARKRASRAKVTADA